MSKNKERVRGYSTHKEYFDEFGHKHTVLVYGEVTISKIDVEVLPFVYTSKMLKTFNMGWAICAEGDEFDEEYGKKLAKKRFYKYMGDLQTTNKNFLNDDMVMAILQNEVNYIIKHADKYVKNTQTLG